MVHQDRVGFCWPSGRPRATSPCPPNAVLHIVAWYEYTFGVVTTRLRVLKASSSYFIPSRKGVPLASQGGADWVRPGPQARAGIGQALVGRRSDHEDAGWMLARGGEKSPLFATPPLLLGGSELTFCLPAVV